ncbi:MAG: hypothetical protein HY721_12765 [Planctomycetes bacterium]|nr:hypothetical protein [Planctomycetota bacterium]
MRPLHAKALWLGRYGEREILLVGSSNASPAGLGLGGHPRNVEANLCFLHTGDRRVQRWFDACFPEAPALEPDQVRLAGAPRAADEEGGPPPLPLFFRWAALDRSGEAMLLHLGLGGSDEPRDWRIAVEGGQALLDAREHRRSGSPNPWQAALPGDPATAAPPTILEVRWEAAEGRFLGHLPINALNSSSRTRPDLWRDIDLDALLEILSSSGPVHRALARALRRREARERSSLPVELDPHRRVDASSFLMQRIRRISRALEGLKDRLRAPVFSEVSLEWRLQGPLSPAYLARRLIDAAVDPEEKKFLLAEVALVLGSAARDVTAAGVALEEVRERYRSALADLRAMVPDELGTPLVDRYLEESFARAQA